MVQHFVYKYSRDFKDFTKDQNENKDTNAKDRDREFTAKNKE